MGVSENRGTPKSSMLIGFSIINQVKPSILGYPYFLETPIYYPVGYTYIYIHIWG